MAKSSSFTGGKLSLKGDKKKSKKKSKKSKHRLGESGEDAEAKTLASPSRSRPDGSHYGDDESGDEGHRNEKDRSDNGNSDVEEDLTAAEKRSRKFKQQQERKEMGKVVSMSHRERVEQFNEKLGKLTEHNDIPRVSAAGNG